MEENNDEELELLAAASNWAESGELLASSDEEQPNKNIKEQQRRDVAAGNVPGASSHAKEQRFSLHITQLSYDATDYDIRDFFATKGCLVKSVRLVYDKEDVNRKFRGVAFIDVADEKSFEIATKLHRSYHLGRRINVRPTRSREELKRIVEATKDKVSNLITASAIAGNGTAEQSQTTSFESKTGKELSRNKNNQKRKTTRWSRHRKSEERKLTKKERNRKAAILMAKRRNKK